MTEDNLVYLSPFQGELVAALETHLEDARQGRLLSFVGCGLWGDDDELTLVCHGCWQSEPYAHIGGLTAIAARLSELALEDDEAPKPKKA